MTVTAILPVPAGFAEHRDAVFTPVAGRSPLARILAALAGTGEVVVAAAGEIADPIRETLAGERFSAVRLVVAEPPGEQAQCVSAGLRGLPADAHVLLHDLRWPIVPTAAVRRIAEELSSGAPAALPVRPVTDSVKVVDAQGTLTATLDRAPLRTVQYPRGYTAETLARLVDRRLPGPFDDLEAALADGVDVVLVDGDDTALRIVSPDDTDYLAALIEARDDPPGR